MLDSRGFITLMTPTQALISILVMADHSHNWYDETTTKENINESLDNIDATKESFKEAHPAKECPLKKEAANDEWISEFIENIESNIREIKTTTKNLEEKAYQLTQTVLTNTVEKFKARTAMGKEDMKEPILRDLPPMPFLRHLKEKNGSSRMEAKFETV
nr:hypothetical protein [Tanacetum cinerariifolium]